MPLFHFSIKQLHAKNQENPRSLVLKSLLYVQFEVECPRKISSGVSLKLYWVLFLSFRFSFISFVLVSFLLTFNIFHILIWCLRCWLCTSKCQLGVFYSNCIGIIINPVSASSTKWSNLLKQFICKLPTNCLSVFDHFVGLALKGFTIARFQIQYDHSFPSFFISCRLISWALRRAKYQRNMRSAKSIGHIVRSEHAMTSLSLTYKISMVF